MGFILPIPVGGFLGPAGDDVLDTTERELRPHFGEGLYGGEGKPHQGYRRGQAWGQAYIRASMDALAANAIPDRAIELLPEWEETLGLSPGTRLTLEDRMARVRLRCRTGHLVYRLRYSGAVTGAISAGDWVVQDGTLATGTVAVHDTTNKLLVLRCAAGRFNTTGHVHVDDRGSANHVTPNLGSASSDEVASADALSILTRLGETVGYFGDPADGPFMIEVYPVVRTLAFQVSVYEFVPPPVQTVIHTYDAGKYLSFVPGPHFATVGITTGSGPVAVSATLGAIRVTDLLPGTTTYANLLSAWNAAPGVADLATLTGTAGTFPSSYAGMTPTPLYDATWNRTITRTNRWGVEVLSTLRRIKPSHVHCFVRWMDEAGSPVVDLGA